ncbi:MAG: ABC transporter ATP-binding protein [Firmicutes bacterium]|nr:ABC transporter ATP-binding protein [Bacillota bacterium]
MEVLHVTGLTKHFGGLTAVSEFDFSLKNRELAGLIGPNGAGKTTVFNLMTGILKPDQGSVLFQGEDLAGKPPHISSNKGLVRTFQNIRLMSNMTVMENLMPAFHHRINYSLAGAMLGTPDFKKVETEMENTIADVLGKMDIIQYAYENVTDLPYGVQRKVDIARALCMNPKVLLLDEPTAGLNPIEADEIVNIIKYLNENLGISLVVIEHNMRVIMSICTRIVVMHEGSVIAEGTPGEIQDNPDVARVYLGSRRMYKAVAGGE